MKHTFRTYLALYSITNQEKYANAYKSEFYDYHRLAPKNVATIPDTLLVSQSETDPTPLSQLIPLNLP